MRILMLLIVAALSLGCNQKQTDLVKIRMEVAYPVYGNILKQPRVWAVYRAPLSLVRGMKVDEKIAASIQCIDTMCKVSEIQKLSTDRSVATIHGRLLQKNEELQEALLIFDPFPVITTAQLHDQLRFDPSNTKIIDTHYILKGNRLIFQQLALTKVEQKPPVRWK